MRRYSPAYFVFASCCFVNAFNASRALGDDQRSTATFRTPTFTQSPDEAATPPALQEPSPAESPPPAPIATIPVPTTSVPPRAVPHIGATPAVYAQPAAANQARQALGFYGRSSTPSQLPRRAPIQPSGPRPMRRQTKPFQNIERDPAISPYLNLDRNEDDAQGVPNYFTFVRPQLEQLQTNRMQQREIQQLRGQLQGMSSVNGPQYQATGSAGTGASARFMDTAQFYGGLR